MKYIFKNKCFATGIVVIFLSNVFTSMPVYAWNIICGFSVGLVLEHSEEKWDADSYAIRSMGQYYVAIAAFQKSQSGGYSTLDLRPDGLVERLFSSSMSNIETALELAGKYGLGDEKGLSLLHSMYDEISSLKRNVSLLSSGLDDSLYYDQKSLVSRQIVQVIDIIKNYTRYGVELSQEHLSIGLEGHGVGGLPNAIVIYP